MFGPQNQARRPEATETVIRELREASRRGARGVIAGLVSMLSKAAVEACPLDEDLTKMPLRGCIFISSCRGSVVIYLPPMDFV